VRHGFRRVLVLNGHGGNATALSNITQELSDELDADVLAMTYWTVGSAEVAIKAELDAQDGILHAGRPSPKLLRPTDRPVLPTIDTTKVVLDKQHETAARPHRRGGD
jgi:hypothetical protein